MENPESKNQIFKTQESTIFSMFEMTLTDGLCDENPHQA